MKVALILASNTCYTPHLYHYKRILQEKKIDFDIIIWNKDNSVENECISYNNFFNLKKSKLFRVRGYLEYTKFVIEVLRQKKYERVVVFTVFLGVLLYPFLYKKLKKAYIFDIRDYSPILNFIPRIINPIIKNSFATTISSPGFTKWLPQSKDYLLSHNYQFNDKFLAATDDIKKESKYTILTIGFLRDFEANKRIINSFKNNNKFVLKFVGRGIAYEPLKKFVTENNIENVIFTGGYDKKDEKDFLKEASIMNIFLDDDINSRTLMTNRLYLSVANKIPILVNKNSTQGEYANKYKLGVAIEKKEAISEIVLSYLDKLDKNKFLKGRDSFLVEIAKDQEKFEMAFMKFLL
jgi:hypothetical protein